MNPYLIVGMSGIHITETESLILSHPAVQGVILFSRNFKNKKQLQELCGHLHGIKKPALQIYVDQEGGRVQRFQEGFSVLSALGSFGQLYQSSSASALVKAKQSAYQMAHELKEVGVDQSFAPVVDLDRGSRVIGDRSFSSDPRIVVDLAHAYIEGMADAEMSAVLKHFPGHGSVIADSHYESVKDERSLAVIEQEDLYPFMHLLQHPNVLGVMMAHVIYPAVDPSPASLSSYWIQHMLRKRLQFKGYVFSDDLDMKAVKDLGSPGAVVKKALEAGCNYVLICNDFAAIAQCLR